MLKAKQFANTQAHAQKLSRQEPSHYQVLNMGKAPAPWQQDRVWIDLIPGAEAPLPGMALRCVLNRVDGEFQLAVEWNLSGTPDVVKAELGQIINLRHIVGYHCYLIPRALRPCTDLNPAAVLLEINSIRIPQQ